MQKHPAVGEKRLIALVQKLRSIDVEKRTIEFVASTETTDRYGDVIRVSGWETRNYMRNPVFLWAHRSSDPPIGKTVKLFTETTPPALVQVVQFADKDTYPFADTIFNLYRDGFMNAVSVGFKPTEKPKPIRNPDTDQITGFEFTKQELMELSAVPLPANPDALARGFDETKYSKDELDVIHRCGDKNTPWSYLVPGVTFSPSDLTKEADAAPEEEAAHAAPPTNGREHRSSGRTSIAEIMEKLVLTNTHVESLASTMVKRAELGETLNRIDDVKTQLRGLTTAVRDLSGVLATKDDVEVLVPDFEQLVRKLDKISAAAAKEASLADVAASMQQLTKQLEKALTGILRKTDLQDLSAKVDAGRDAVSSLEGVVAKSADVRRFHEALGEVRSRVSELFKNVELNVAKAPQVDALLANFDALLDRVGELRDKVAASVGAEHTRVAVLQSAATSLEELRAAFDAAAGNTSTQASIVTSISSAVQTLAERFDLFRADAANGDDVKQLLDRVSEQKSLLDGVLAVVRDVKQKLFDIDERIEDGCKRIDTLADHVAHIELANKQRVEQEIEERRAVCPYTDDPIADKGTKWDASAEMAKQSTPTGWRHMSTVINGDPANKTSYKLPHHAGIGFKVIPNGVRAALARVEQTQMASNDRAGARAHLARHQKKIAAMKGFDFDVETFERHLDELGRVYRAAEERGDEQERASAEQMILRYVEKSCTLTEETPAPPHAPEHEAPVGNDRLTSFVNRLRSKQRDVPADPDEDEDPLKPDEQDDGEPNSVCATPKCNCKGFVGPKNAAPTTTCKRVMEDGAKCAHPRSIHTGSSS